MIAHPFVLLLLQHNYCLCQKDEAPKNASVPFSSTLSSPLSRMTVFSLLRVNGSEKIHVKDAKFFFRVKWVKSPKQPLRLTCHVFIV